MHDVYEREFITNSCAFDHYNTAFKVFSTLKIKDKRAIFQLLRTTPNISPHHLLSHYGLTVGEFSVFQILGENLRKKKE